MILYQMSQPKAQREVKRADIGSKQGHKKTLELIALNEVLDQSQQEADVVDLRKRGRIENI
jgi:hypothetical protein